MAQDDVLNAPVGLWYGRRVTTVRIALTLTDLPSWLRALAWYTEVLCCKWKYVLGGGGCSLGGRLGFGSGAGQSPRRLCSLPSWVLSSLWQQTPWSVDCAWSVEGATRRSVSKARRNQFIPKSSDLCWRVFVIWRHLHSTEVLSFSAIVRCKQRSNPCGQDQRYTFMLDYSNIRG